MSAARIYATGALSAVADCPFLAVACDPETYQTLRTSGIGIVEAWKELMFCPPWDAPDDEVQEFDAFAQNPDNWYQHEGQLCSLVWEVAGDACGTISFYRLTHDERPNETQDQLRRALSGWCARKTLDGKHPERRS
jgi:hypothetical protein